MSSHQQRPVDEQARTKPRPVALVVALALMALVLLFALWDLQLPAPKSVDAPPDGFSAGRAMAVLQELLAEGVPHPVGSENNDRVGSRILAMLEGLGYEVDIQEAVVCRSWSGATVVCAPINNIVTRLPGRENGPAVMVAAHYDSVGAGPGAADDTANVAAIIEIARALKAHGPYRNPIIFLFTDGEEVGLLGAQWFAKDHPWAKDVGVAINLEARGTSGPSLMFETSEDNAWLIDAYASSVPRPAASSLSYEIYKIMPNDTDLTAFRAAGMAGLNFAFIENSHYYHTSRDNLENLNPGSLQHQGESVLAVTRQLATMDLSSPPAGNAAYTTVPAGLGMIRWPMAWTLPLALLLMLPLLAAAGWLIRRGDMKVSAVLWGTLAALLSVVLPILLSLGLTWAMVAITGVSAPWYAYPLPARASLWAGTLFCSGLVATGLARRAGTWGLGLGVWFLWSLLALFLSFTMPGMAILFLVPLFCAEAFMAVVAFSRLSRSAPARDAAFIAAALIAGLVWLQSALITDFSVGLEMSAIVILPVALIVSTLLPLLVLPQADTWVRKWWFTIAAAAVTVIAAVIALFMPTYSESSPQPLNIYHYEDRNAGVAHWVAAPFREETPDPLRQQFDAEPLVVFPWSNREHPVTKAPTSTLPAPDLRLLSDDRVDGERVVKAQLRSPRIANEIDLLVQIGNLKSVTVAGGDFSVNPADSWNGYYQLWCYGRGCDGLELTLRFKNADPVEALLIDYSPGLPPAGESLIRARPATAVPFQSGDATLILHRVRF